jgi:prepilin-type N-terminal cleavage/methylation domain-containing protein
MKKGLTVIEILIAIAVLGIIIATALPQFSKFRENQVIKSAENDILSSINKAKSQTLASLDSSSYGVRFESDKVIIFKGTVYSEADPNNETINLVSPAVLTNVTLLGVSGTTGELYFSRLSGMPSKSGTLTLATTNYTKTITISATGTTSVN